MCSHLKNVYLPFLLISIHFFYFIFKRILYREDIENIKKSLLLHMTVFYAMFLEMNGKIVGLLTAVPLLLYVTLYTVISFYMELKFLENKVLMHDIYLFYFI